MTASSENTPKAKLPRQVFKPTLRFLFDVLLLFNSLLFALLAAKAIQAGVLLSIGAGVNLFFILIWILLVRPLLQIEMKDGMISGPSDIFTRKTLPLRKVDVRRSLEYSRRSEFLGYRDLWSVDGEHIRLYRRFLGKAKHYQIVKLIREHPFRESAPSSPPPPAG